MANPRRHPRRKVRVDLGQTLGQVVLQVAPSNVIAPQRPMTPVQLADFLGVHPNTIKRHAHEWPSFRVGNRTKFDGASVVKYLMEKKAAEDKK